MSITLVPAVIPYEIDLAAQQINDIKSFSDELQIDIGDGIFTQKPTLQAKDFSKDVFLGLSVELHAMVTNPFSVFDDWVNLGIKRIVVHVEARPSAQQLQSLIAKGVTLTLGLNATTPISFLGPYTHIVSSYLFLTIDPPGHQGGSLIPEALKKARQFHDQYTAFEITVDGGANAQTLQTIIDAGAHRIVVGSALQEKGHFSEKKFASLQSLISA